MPCQLYDHKLQDRLVGQIHHNSNDKLTSWAGRCAQLSLFGFVWSLETITITLHGI